MLEWLEKERFMTSSVQRAISMYTRPPVRGAVLFLTLVLQPGEGRGTRPVSHPPHSSARSVLDVRLLLSP